MLEYKKPTKGYYAYLQTLVRDNPDADLPTLQRLAGMGDYAADQGVSLDMYENPQQMLEDMQARQANEAEARARRQARAARPATPAQPAGGAGVSQAGGNASMYLNPMAPFIAQQNAIGATNRAIADEMDSRVAQSRERRRQLHEQGLLGMRADSEYRMLLARLQHERLMFERQMALQKQREDREYMSRLYGGAVIGADTLRRMSNSPRDM